MQTMLELEVSEEKIRKGLVTKGKIRLCASLVYVVELYIQVTFYVDTMKREDRKL